MARRVSDGLTLDYTPGSAVSAGDVVLLTDLLTVATHDIPANVLGAVAYNGIYELPKASGAIALGAAVYWDAGNSNITTTATSNKFAGHATKAAASGDTVVEVLLNV